MAATLVVKGKKRPSTMMHAHCRKRSRRLTGEEERRKEVVRRALGLKTIDCFDNEPESSNREMSSTNNRCNVHKADLPASAISSSGPGRRHPSERSVAGEQQGRMRDLRESPPFPAQLESPKQEILEIWLEILLAFLATILLILNFTIASLYELNQSNFTTHFSIIYFLGTQDQCDPFQTFEVRASNSGNFALSSLPERPAPCLNHHVIPLRTPRSDTAMRTKSIPISPGSSGHAQRWRPPDDQSQRKVLRHGFGRHFISCGPRQNGKVLRPQSTSPRPFEHHGH